MGIEVRGDFCLAGGRRQWQATLLRDLVSGQWMTQEMALYPDGLAFSTKQALVLIEQRGLVRPEFQATMSVDLESDVAALMPEFTSPFHVMESYLLQMESAEVLERSRGKWRLHDRMREVLEGRRFEEQQRRDLVEWQEKVGRAH